MRRPDFRAQLDTLIERGVSIHLGSLGALAAMLLQAPIIGGFIGLAWKGQEPVAQTHFVMSVAALWMGCLNACTAIVHERAVYERERMFDLDVRAYLLSKLAVLCAVGVAQSVLLLAAQGWLMHLKESPLSLALTFLALASAGISASGLGLLVSACARTAYGAVVSVPILLVPQILFSELVLQANVQSGLPRTLERLTITKWCAKALGDAAGGIDWGVQLGSHAALAAGLAAFLALAYAKLRIDEL